MIKPASYWALHKTCDPLTLGRVAATLGGQTVEPPLNAAEMALVNLVHQDSEWMDERIDAKRKRWAKAKSERRAKDGAEQNPETDGDKRRQVETTGDNGRQAETSAASPNVSMCLGVSDTIHPSVHPSSTLDNTNVLSASTQNTRVRADVPELKVVVSAATSAMGVPEWYARWWYEQMVAYDWTSTKGIRIGHENWRAVLKAWHNRTLGDPKEYERVRSEYEAKKPKVVKVTAEDWCLCAERCARFKDGRCGAGKVVPPQMRPHVIPPEECDGFAPLGAAGLALRREVRDGARGDALAPREEAAE